jgi:IS30 family transposase
MSQHAQVTIDIGMMVHYANVKCPWQCGINRSANLECRSFPKGTNRVRWTAQDIHAAIGALNNRCGGHRLEDTGLRITSGTAASNTPGLRPPG